MRIKKGPLLYSIAFLAGIISEFVGFQLEQWMIRAAWPARIGFPVSLFIFTIFPYLSTGVIVYKTTKDVFAALVLSTMVIPATLAIITYFRI